MHETDKTGASTACGGYVLAYRRTLDHHAFRSHGEALAFTYLTMLASWKDTTVRYKGRVINLHRGQLAISIRDLANHLERSKQWAERFINRLRTETMIETVSVAGLNVITICNYDTFQSRRDSAETPAETKPRQDRDSTETQNKEEKEKKEGKEEKGRVARATQIKADWVLPDEWREFAKTSRGWSDSDVLAEANDFRDWHITNKKARKDWFLTWRKWVERSYRKPNQPAKVSLNGMTVKERVNELLYEKMKNEEMALLKPMEERGPYREKYEKIKAELDALRAAYPNSYNWASI